MPSLFPQAALFAVHSCSPTPVSVIDPADRTAGLTNLIADLQYRLFTLPSHPSSILYPTNAFRPYCWLPLVLHGYSIAAGSAQACLVVSHRTSALQPARRRSSLFPPAMDCSRSAKPAVVNSFFWTGLLFFLLVLLVRHAHSLPSSRMANESLADPRHPLLHLLVPHIRQDCRFGSVPRPAELESRRRPRRARPPRRLVRRDEGCCR